MNNLQLTQPAEQLLAGDDTSDSVANHSSTPILVWPLPKIGFSVVKACFVHASHYKCE